MTEEAKDNKADETQKPSTETGGEGAAQGEAAQTAEKPKVGKKIILLLIPILLLIIGAFVYFFLLKKDSPPEDEHKKSENTDVFKGAETPSQNYFVNLEDFVVDLSSQNNRPSFLKLSITLSLFKETDTAVVNSKLPIIRDNFQLYLRELREADLNGSGGMYKLKEELLIRLNKILYPVQVKDILFREILIR
ncbi:MAG: flagellar basal body protein FliL [Rickettsiaceae bacterium]|jgi:flagellar FliL protein|nr:flagellar basal body protein FliL [Rickettsiaceae bacterium]